MATDGVTGIPSQIPGGLVTARKRQIAMTTEETFVGKAELSILMMMTREASDDYLVIFISATGGATAAGLKTVLCGLRARATSAGFRG